MASPQIGPRPPGAALKLAELSLNRQTSVKAAADLDAHAVRWRRGVRCCSCVALVVLGCAAWSISMVPNLTMSVSYRYDPAWGLTVEVEACDVEMVAGAAPTIEYTAVGHLAFHRWLKDPTDASTVRVATLANLKGDCQGVPMQECGRLCRVSVTVPPSASASRFVFRQPRSDVGSFPRLAVRRNVSIGALQVGDRNNVPPSLELYVEGASIGSLSTNLLAGDARVTGSHVGSTALKARGSGSIYLLDVPALAQTVRASYRQPAGRFCIATDLRASDASFVPAPIREGAGCDFGDLSGGNAQRNFGVYNKAASSLDGNGDGRVTKAEFNAAMAKLTCCGSDSPFGCWCDPFAYRVFPPTESAKSDRFDLPVWSAIEHIVHANMSSLLGKPGSGGCFSTVVAHAAGASSERSIQAWSDGGEVVVTLRQAATAAVGCRRASCSATTSA